MSQSSYEIAQRARTYSRIFLGHALGNTFDKLSPDELTIENPLNSKSHEPVRTLPMAAGRDAAALYSALKNGEDIENLAHLRDQFVIVHEELLAADKSLAKRNAIDVHPIIRDNISHGVADVVEFIHAANLRIDR